MPESNTDHKSCQSRMGYHNSQVSSSSRREPFRAGETGAIEESQVHFDTVGKFPTSLRKLPQTPFLRNFTSLRDYSPSAASTQKANVPSAQTGACQRRGLFRHAPPTANRNPARDSIDPHLMIFIRLGS
jgi:hypothetical protein